MQKLALCLAALAGLRAATASGTPVEKIVKLLEDLRDEAQSTGAKEKQLYDEYTCWCSDTTQEKGKAIEDAKSQLVKLGGDIQENTAKVSTLTADIGQLMSDCKTAEDSNKEGLAIRKTEHEEWLAESNELRQAITALDAAIVVLRGKPLEFKELLQRANWVAVAAAVPRAQLLTLAPKQASLLSAWLADMSKVRAQEKSGKKPPSSTILGILKQMHEDFTKDLDARSKEETQKQKDFDELMKTKQKELADMRADAAKKAGEKADAEKLLSAQSQEYDETDEQLKSDKKFFEAVQCSCLAKAMEFKDRSKLREEELEGINKALGILTSDDARALFGKSMDDYSRVQFLQLDAAENAAPAAKAFKVLKAVATKAHSIRLAKLAARVRVVSRGHFDEVIGAIDKVIQTLKDEEKEDISKRDQCKDEYQEIASTVADLEWKISNNEKEIAKLEKIVEDSEGKKAKTIEDIAKTEEEIKQMETARKEEHEEFLEEKDYDEQAIELLKSAKVALSKYYEDRGMDVSDFKPVLVQFKPEEDCESLKARAPQFSKEGKNRQQTKGVVGLMTLLIEDLEEEIANSVKADEASQAEFETALKAAKKLKGELEDKKVTLEELIADTQEDIGTEEGKMKDNNKDLKSEKDYKAEIKPDCDWVIGAFESRREARKAEMDGLVEAKEYLAGAKVPGEEGLLQRPSQGRFNDDAFPSIDFSRLSFLQRRQP